MKGRIFASVTFALVLLLCLFGVTRAEAVEANVQCPYYAFTAMDGSTVDKTSLLGKPCLIIFYGNDCGNSSGSIREAANAEWASNPNLTILAAEVKGLDHTQLQDFADAYGNGGQDILFCAGGNGAMWNFLATVGHGSNSVTLPASFLVDGNGVIRHYQTGYTTVNNYRDMLLGYVAGVNPPANVTFGVSGTYDYEAAFQVLALLNEQRVANGLSALTLDTRLLEAAMQRAAECSVYYDHTRPNGERCYTVPDFVGGYRGENIAAGYGSPAAVMDGWMNSEGHRNNILNSNFTSVGLGVFRHGGTLYWVQIFSDIRGTAAVEKPTVQGTAQVEAVEDILSLYANFSELNMDPGETTGLWLYTVNMGWPYQRALIEGENLVFTSSNPSVATVSADGIVTAVSGGTATVTVSIRGGTQKVTVPVTVKNTVSITKQPSSAIVRSGQTATVKVTASGDGLKYQWYIKNANGTYYSKSSVTSATYSVTMSSTTRDRYLYCVVTDQYGNSVQTKTVRLRQAATVTAQPKTAYAKQGATASVTVKATGDGLKYTWYVKNAGSSTWIKSSATGSTYFVKMTSTTRNRQLYCVVTDNYGKTVKTNTVYLRMAATITKQPASVVVENGEKATVKVTAVGDGLTYRWYYKDKGAKDYTYTSAFTGNTYSVNMIDARAGRRVICRVYDKYGNVVASQSALLSQAVRIKTQPKSVVVKNGEKATVKVTAVGDGLTYRWYFKDKGDKDYTYTDSFKGSTYSITMTDARAGRRVLCRVYDKYGNVVASQSALLSQAVRITKQPASVTVSKGSTAKTTVTAVGDGLTYQWYVKNAGTSTWIKSSVTDDTYAVTMSSAAKNRQLYCVVTDKYGKTAKTVTVTLKQK